VNSNPATIMTDPDLADRTYIEPLTPDYLERIIEKERPQALLPTLGGQTALNLAVACAERGVLEKYDVELIGAKLETIRKAEDRQIFKQTMEAIGLDLPRSLVVTDGSEVKSAARELGFPIIVRASFTLGGAGGGIAYHLDELREKVLFALEASPIKKVLVEESALGWKEFELEVMRDKKDNFVVICSIENIDPMGIHTGDSITVAPAQTLTDAQYQELRDQAKKIVSAVGVETGGCNIQFAVHPRTGRIVVIEINPRVSRSSALASKATGFPIAKIAAKLAVGYTLDEIPNDITKATPSSFEPSIDYVVTKAPRFAAEKFGDFPLDTAMKSVGEVMAIGRTFKESFQKALRGLETGRAGFEPELGLDDDALRQKLAIPSSIRIFVVRAALDRGMSPEEIAEITAIDPWFLNQMQEIVHFEKSLTRGKISPDLLRQAKRFGVSDARMAKLRNTTEHAERALRQRLKIRPVYKIVDTCAGEFESKTPYFYSTYDDFGDLKPKASKRKVIIIGSGPNRIGQGIEFDYCCVQAALALKTLGYESIMLNCNPETVSTDYDTSDRLYFEPLTLEDVLEVIAFEKPLGVIVQFGGQTPLNLTIPLFKAGVPILGTHPRSIDAAEDRKLFGALIKRLGIPAPDHGTAANAKQALQIARRVGYPVMVRPSYVLGGRAMEVADDEAALVDYLSRHKESRHPSLLIDRFLSNAAEIDVDAVSDGHDVYIAGIMEHIEEAGIHSGDSACTLPPHSLDAETLATVARYTRELALALKVVGLINIQFAVKDGKAYILEANPRASRTLPFVSKATGIPVAKLATSVMMGKRLSRILPAKFIKNSPMPLPYSATKEVVLPFNKFPGIDPRLGPEMQSTGEVMGIDADFPRSFAKSQEASGLLLPSSGQVFLSVRDEDKPEILDIARKLSALGFQLVATTRTRQFLLGHGVESQKVAKLGEGKPDVVDLIKQKSICLAINTPSGRRRDRADGYEIRRTALEVNIPCITNLRSARAALQAIAAARESKASVKPIQDYYRELPHRMASL
jgi:carbamoyl-phosphate synthase large subunit